MTGGIFFCYYICMKLKRGQKNKNNISPMKEESFFVQTNIDDLTKDINKNENTPEEQLEDKIIEEIKEENKEENLEETEKEPLKTQENEEQKEIEEAYSEQDKSELDTIVSEFNNEIALNNQPENLQDDNKKNLDQRKKLDEIEQSVSKQSSKKSKIINVVFFIINILIVAGILVYQFLNEDMPEGGLNIDISYLLVCILIFGLVLVFDTLSISYLLKVSCGKWNFGLGYKVAEIGRYYDSVTPMATGGQPFQITYLKKRGTPLHTSLSIPLAKYEFQQMAWVVMSLICLIISFTTKGYGTFVGVTSILGFVLSSIVLFVTVFLSVCKTFGRKLVVKVLKLLYKMKIIKNYDKQYERITKYISDFQDVMKQYAKSPKDFIAMFLISTAKLLVNYSIPFFIVKIFIPDLPGSEYITLFVMSLLVDLSASFFPLPGGTGMNEISFTAAFGAVIHNSGVLVWVLLVWRLFSYYIYLIQGMLILSYDMAYGNRKYHWQVKKNELMEESSIFKQNQIDRFRAERAKRRRKKVLNK